jgi:hypothetical protein
MAGPADMMIDMPLDMFDARCFGKAPFTTCLSMPPTSSVTLPQNINTDSTGQFNCTASGGTVELIGTSAVEACVFAGTTVNASGSIIGVFGSRPLVVLSSGNLNVSTPNFDISSGSGGNGPNANPADCAPAMNMNGQSSGNGGGGGAGGSFGARGGEGGVGGSGVLSGGTAKPADTAFNKLRGGCAGGQGAGPSGAAAGGAGGGAVYLVARGTLTIDGTINASGAGGTGGQGPRGGGGGGGSGGMVVLHATNLNVNVVGRVFANGGGGGGGAGASGTNGGAGADPTVADVGAMGGQRGDIQGAPGGTGGFKATVASDGTAAVQGAGGGGGGVGVIRILSGQSPAPLTVSPTPILN